MRLPVYGALAGSFMLGACVTTPTLLGASTGCVGFKLHLERVAYLDLGG